MPDVLLRISHCAGCDQAGTGFLYCHRCGQTKPLSEFYPNRKRGRTSYHSGCKPCRRTAAKVYLNAHYVPHPRRRS